MKIATLDFETFAIAPRPAYPPVPVGLAIRATDVAPWYYGWGHPTDNNTDEHVAVDKAADLLAHNDLVLMHNAAFDAAILDEKWHLTVPWEKVRCTMVLAFLVNPHGELSLKPLCERLLALPPTERDAVRDWLVKHGVVSAASKKWGAFIAFAPGILVGSYAIGDVDRTEALYHALIANAPPNVLGAYEREMALMPYVHQMEKDGIYLDTVALAAAAEQAQIDFAKLDVYIKGFLGDVDIDSNVDLADAIEEAQLSKGFGLTPKGKRSVAKDSLIDAISDPTLLGHLLVRNSLATCIRTFMLPWLELAQANGGVMYMKWNQVRNYSDTGARTGRISSSPNLQNVPSVWEKLRSQLDRIGYKLDVTLPNMRDYIVAPPGEVLVGRDYSAQEMRLLAHFAGGKLLAELRANPAADPHQVAADVAHITRKVAKTLGFAILYGAGVGKIAESLYIPVQEATQVKAKYLAAMPDIAQFQKAVQNRGRAGLTVKTLGGREYKAEEPKLVGGVWKTFEYKLVNYLIQGSAADQTKQAMLDYARRTKHGALYLTVHDEIIIRCPEQHAAEEDALLKQCMEESFVDVLDCPFITTGAIGRSYAELK